jgi:anti-sigma B factor antagonist
MGRWRVEIVQPLAIAVEYPAAGTAVLRPTGRLNLLTAPELQRRLLAEVLAGRRLLVVDLGAATFLDSAGLSALVKGLTAARRAGGDLRLARPTEQVATVLQLTALDRVLRPYATVQRAIAGRNPGG